MLNCVNSKAIALALTAAMGAVGTISARHSNTVAQANPSARRVAEKAVGSVGVTSVGVTAAGQTPTPPFDETPITPRETVGASADAY